MGFHAEKFLGESIYESSFLWALYRSITTESSHGIALARGLSQKALVGVASRTYPLREACLRRKFRETDQERILRAGACDITRFLSNSSLVYSTWKSWSSFGSIGRWKTGRRVCLVTSIFLETNSRYSKSSSLTHTQCIYLSFCDLAHSPPYRCDAPNSLESRWRCSCSLSPNPALQNHAFPDFGRTRQR